ncbi:phosphatidate cytidylyltransferase [Chryseobacterium lacus]|nr:phosphatidate cytidylyltransferase [Chryseobacterium lacus]
MMRKISLFSLLILSAMLLTSCDAIATIFEAGMWWGIILVVGVIGLILWLLTRGRKG